MTNQQDEHSGAMSPALDAEETGFGDEEFAPLSEEEMREANVRAEIFLEEDRAEREALAEQFEEELDALLATIKPGAPEPEAKRKADPPGWPDF